MQNKLLLFFYRFKTFYNSSFKSELNRYDMSQAEADIILFLKNNPDFNTARDICNMRGLAKSNVSTSLRELKRKKYITVSCDGNSKKLHRLFLNDEHKDIFNKLAEIQKKCFAEMLNGITKEEVQFFIEFLKKCDKNITDNSAEI